MLNADTGSDITEIMRIDYAPYVNKLLSASIMHEHHISKELTKLFLITNEPSAVGEVERKVSHDEFNEGVLAAKRIHMDAEEYGTRVKAAIDYLSANPDYKEFCYSCGRYIEISSDIMVGVLIQSFCEQAYDKSIYLPELYPALKSKIGDECPAKLAELMPNMFMAYCLNKALVDNKTTSLTNLDEKIGKIMQKEYNLTHPPVEKKGLFGVKQIEQKIPPQLCTMADDFIEKYREGKIELKKYDWFSLSSYIRNMIY